MVEEKIEERVNVYSLPVKDEVRAINWQDEPRLRLMNAPLDWEENRHKLTNRESITRSNMKIIRTSERIKDELDNMLKKAHF